MSRTKTSGSTTRSHLQTPANSLPTDGPNPPGGGVSTSFRRHPHFLQRMINDNGHGRQTSGSRRYLRRKAASTEAHKQTQKPPLMHDHFAILPTPVHGDPQTSNSPIDPRTPRHRTHRQRQLPDLQIELSDRAAETLIPGEHNAICLGHRRRAPHRHSKTRVQFTVNRIYASTTELWCNSI